MQIVPEAKAQDNVAVFEPGLTELTTALRRALRARMHGSGPFARLEAEALSISNEAIRRVLEEELQQRADSEPAEISIDGKLFRRHQPGTVQVHSLCGPMSVKRWTYREVGERNGPTCALTEAAAGLIEHATPALAQAIGRGYAERTSRALHADLVSAGRAPPSRSTIERIAVELGQQVKAAVHRIEPALRHYERVPRAARGVTVGLDRTTVPMAERDDRGELEVRYRMAYVATITVADGTAEPLQTRRYAAPAHEGPDQILSRIEADLRCILKQRPKINVALVQDGAAEMWNLTRPVLRRVGLKKWIERIDRYHLEQHLAAALEILTPDAATRTTIWSRWRASLTNDDRAIYRIRAWIDEAMHGCSQSVFHELYPHIMYILPDRMRYAALKPLGIPMGSGVTEGACKSLITVRTKRSGQRWQKRGIESVLALRSILHSERWPRFWRSFAKPRNAFAQ